MEFDQSEIQGALDTRQAGEAELTDSFKLTDVLDADQIRFLRTIIQENKDGLMWNTAVAEALNKNIVHDPRFPKDVAIVTLQRKANAPTAAASSSAADADDAAAASSSANVIKAFVADLVAKNPNSVSTFIHLLLQHDHYDAIIDGKTEETKADGSCYYNALTILLYDLYKKDESKFKQENDLLEVFAKWREVEKKLEYERDRSDNPELDNTSKLAAWRALRQLKGLTKEYFSNACKIVKGMTVSEEALNAPVTHLAKELFLIDWAIVKSSYEKSTASGDGDAQTSPNDKNLLEGPFSVTCRSLRSI